MSISSFQFQDFLRQKYANQNLSARADMQQANAAMAGVGQRGQAAQMQFAPGGTEDRQQIAETKRKKMDIDQSQYQFDKDYPLKASRNNALNSVDYAQAGNLNSETAYNRAVLPSYVAGAEYDVKAMKRKEDDARIAKINSMFVPDKPPLGSSLSTPREEPNPYRVPETARPTGFRPLDATLRGAGNVFGGIHQLFDYSTYRGRYNR